MADRSDTTSDGSDIDAEELSDYEENDENFNDFDRNFGPANGNNRNYVDFDGFFDSDSDDSGSEFDGFDYDWKRDEFTDRNIREFSGNGGVSALHPEETRPIQYFFDFWDDTLWNHIVTETNRYAFEERSANPPPPFAPTWVDVDVRTMKAFIGLCFVMGIMKLPCRSDYWRVSKRMFRTRFNEIMTRDRFNLIWRYLHLHNRQAPPLDVPDKLIKIRWFIEYLNEKFSTQYTPYGNITVDESMVKFKGRLAFRQYLPSKPTKWGVKIWTLAESTTGYMSRFQIYTGKEDNQEKGLSHRVVTDLMGHFQDKNFRLYMDNFYTSVDLLNELSIRGIYACGTIRSNRKGLPVDLLPKNTNLQKHQFVVAQKNELSFCNWMDTKSVLVLSNFHSPTDVGYVNRRTGQARQRQVRVPKMLEDYQKHMKGVDLLDQMLGYYMINHRSRKWWRRIFFYLMMATAHNAYVSAKDSNEEFVRREWPCFQDFLEELAEDLIGDVKTGRDAPNLNIPRPAMRHDIQRMYEKAKVCGECRVRAARGVRVGTSHFGCVQCQIPVHQGCVAKHIDRANNM